MGLKGGGGLTERGITREKLRKKGNVRKRRTIPERTNR